MLRKFDSYDGICFFNGLVFFAPVALLIRTQAGVSDSAFFVLQALLSLSILLGEFPTGLITDRIGYKRSILLSQVIMLLSRVLLLCAFVKHSMGLFIAEAIVEGIGNCFSSGTNEAYLYSIYGEDLFTRKAAHSANFGTAGFILSTLTYVLIYRLSGISGLLCATLLSGIIALLFALRLPREAIVEQNFDKSDFRTVLCFFKNPQAVLYILLLSTFSIIWILINFFYVEKLEIAGLSPEWMSMIILIYSAIQMLAEPVLELLKKHPFLNSFPCICAIASGLLIVFGITGQPLLFLPLMCLIPLFVSIPQYLLMEQENIMIDKMGLDRHRAASLSALNMGVNIMEIGALFASSLFNQNTVKWSFLLAGALLALLGMIKRDAKISS